MYRRFVKWYIKRQQMKIAQMDNLFNPRSKKLISESTYDALHMVGHRLSNVGSP